LFKGKDASNELEEKIGEFRRNLGTAIGNCINYKITGNSALPVEESTIYNLINDFQEFIKNYPESKLNTFKNSNPTLQ